MDASPFRAVLFDLGGTLFRYGDLRGRFNRLLLAELGERGHGHAPDDVRRVYGRCMEGAFRVLADRPYYLHSELFREGHRRFLEAFGLEGTAESGLAFYRAQIRLGIEEVQPRSGAVATLEALRARGTSLGVVSNIDDDQFWPLWERMGLAHLFDHTTTSEDARSCKPDPGIFALALERSGAPAPESCLFVGDSPFHDVRGARRVGMHTALITSRPDKLREAAPEERPHHVIRELPELLEIVPG